MILLARSTAVFLLLVTGISSYSPVPTRNAPTPTLQRRQGNIDPTDNPIPRNRDPITPPQLAEPFQYRRDQPDQIPDALWRLLRDTIAWIPIPPTRSDPAFSVTCTETLPTHSSDGPNPLPSNIYDPTLYKDLTDLCAFHGNHIGSEGNWISFNVGCACRSPGLTPFTYCWPPPISNFGLWQSMELKKYCESKCRCTEPYQRPKNRILPDKPIWAAGDISVYHGVGSDGLLVQKSGSDKPDSYKYFAVNGNSNGDWANGWSRTPAAARMKLRNNLLRLTRPRLNDFVEPNPVGSPVCSDSCDASSEFRCSGRDCKCLLKTAGNGLWDVRGCGFIDLLGSGKRDVDQLACACNATYVSRGCCHSDTGVVWEAKEAWLGTMVGQETLGF